jgi:hypothetical protein
MATRASDRSLFGSCRATAYRAGTVFSGAVLWVTPSLP